MPKKQTWLRILKITAVLLPAFLFVCLLPINDFEDTRRLQDFYREEPDSLDVIFLGASDVYAGYSPVLAYEEFGFTGFSYVLSGNYIQLIPGQLTEIHRSQSPKMVVIEITELLKEGGIDDPRFRQFVAGLPLTGHKRELIRQFGEGERLSYYLPFLANHGNTDFQTIRDNYLSRTATRQRGYSLLKGSLTFTGSGENWDGPYVEPVNTQGDASRAEIPREIEDNFRNLLTHCRQQGYENILFVNFPHRITTPELYARYQVTNSVGDLIESYGYDFLNLEYDLDGVGIRPKTDFYNNAHMNLYGQYKVTRYLGKVLTEHYGIGSSTLSPENKARWDACVDYQHDFYRLFDQEFRTREPEEFGLWMKEDITTFRLVEAAKNAGSGDHQEQPQ